jgi:type I restriction enzyme S subunit
MKTNLLQKNIPKDWSVKKIKDLLDFEQPTKYIVESSSYTSTGKTVVLTANKSFVLGHTNETDGVYTDTPAIIFDDFTTDSKYVDFPFKVKSSAIKILTSRDENTDLKFVYEIMKSFDFPIANHKRHYISQYQELDIVVPLINEQKKIAEILSSIDKSIQKVDEVIISNKKLKDGLVRDLFDFKSKKNIKFMSLGEIGKASMCKRIFREQTSNTGDIPFYKIGTFGKKADAFISKELFDTYRKRFSFPKVGDVLLSASGTIGRKVKYDGEPAYFQDSNIIWLEHDESKILNDFLFYLYETIRWETSGSTIKRLYNNAFIKEVVPVPPIDIQQKMVKVLLAVDQKISLNKNLKEKLTRLKKGLMSDLLSGKVRTINN